MVINRELYIWSETTEESRLPASAEYSPTIGGIQPFLKFRVFVLSCFRDCFLFFAKKIINFNIILLTPNTSHEHKSGNSCNR